MAPGNTELPDIAEVFGSLLGRVGSEHQPLLVAIAERMAAERYRDWAGQVADTGQRAELLACADREEEIARRVEGLFPDAESVQRDIAAKNPDLAEISRGLFSEFTLLEQFTLQSRGERLGAATWRSLARRSDDSAARDAYLSCAELEEQSAVVLESIVESAR